MVVDQTFKGGACLEKPKHGRTSIYERGFQHQDHVKMNICISGDAMAMQRYNDQKFVNHAHAKTQHEWGKLVIVTKQCASLPKPTLVKLILKQLLKVFSLNDWGVGSVP
jgi:hypothetical protein